MAENRDSENNNAEEEEDEEEEDDNDYILFLTQSDDILNAFLNNNNDRNKDIIASHLIHANKAISFLLKNMSSVSNGKVVVSEINNKKYKDDKMHGTSSSLLFDTDTIAEFPP
jgi:hypothetical protein